jgi:hypothetical protein
MTHPANPARTPGLHRARLTRSTYHDFFKNPSRDEDALEQIFHKEKWPTLARLIRGPLLVTMLTR